MTSKIDGWCLFNEAQVPVIQTMRFSSEGCFAASSEQGFTRIPDWKDFGIRPVKIIPHDVWEKLMEFLKTSQMYLAGNELDCDDIASLREHLEKILAEVEK